jgi:hypothetical protein
MLLATLDSHILQEVWLKLFDFTEREFKLRETEIATDIENNKYTMSDEFLRR